ncbi:MAG: hypothetical protein KJ977_02285, partial [Candidatus Omnitrophica bacterium]|nr:hypothetical protein [Candidatus Omnitrophota bacterium]
TELKNKIVIFEVTISFDRPKGLSDEDVRDRLLEQMLLIHFHNDSAKVKRLMVKIAKPEGLEWFKAKYPQIYKNLEAALNIQGTLELGGSQRQLIPFIAIRKVKEQWRILNQRRQDLQAQLKELEKLGHDTEKLTESIEKVENQIQEFRESQDWLETDFYRAAVMVVEMLDSSNYVEVRSLTPGVEVIFLTQDRERDKDKSMRDFVAELVGAVSRIVRAKMAGQPANKFERAVSHGLGLAAMRDFTNAQDGWLKAYFGIANTVYAMHRRLIARQSFTGRKTNWADRPGEEEVAGDILVAHLLSQGAEVAEDLFTARFSGENYEAFTGGLLDMVDSHLNRGYSFLRSIFFVGGKTRSAFYRALLSATGEPGKLVWDQLQWTDKIFGKDEFKSSSSSSSSSAALDEPLRQRALEVYRQALAKADLTGQSARRLEQMRLAGSFDESYQAFLTGDIGRGELLKNLPKISRDLLEKGFYLDNQAEQSIVETQAIIAKLFTLSLHVLSNQETGKVEPVSLAKYLNSQLREFELEADTTVSLITEYPEQKQGVLNPQLRKSLLWQMVKDNQPLIYGVLRKWLTNWKLQGKVDDFQARFPKDYQKVAHVVSEFVQVGGRALPIVPLFKVARGGRATYQALIVFKVDRWARSSIQRRALSKGMEVIYLVYNPKDGPRTIRSLLFSFLREVPLIVKEAVTVQKYNRKLNFSERLLAYGLGRRLAADYAKSQDQGLLPAEEAEETSGRDVSAGFEYAFYRDQFESQAYALGRGVFRGSDDNLLRIVGEMMLADLSEDEHRRFYEDQYNQHNYVEDANDLIRDLRGFLNYTQRRFYRKVLGLTVFGKQEDWSLLGDPQADSGQKRRFLRQKKAYAESLSQSLNAEEIKVDEVIGQAMNRGLFLGDVLAKDIVDEMKRVTEKGQNRSSSSETADEHNGQLIKEFLDSRFKRYLMGRERRPEAEELMRTAYRRYFSDKEIEEVGRDLDSARNNLEAARRDAKQNEIRRLEKKIVSLERLLDPETFKQYKQPKYYQRVAAMLLRQGLWSRSRPGDKNGASYADLLSLYFAKEGFGNLTAEIGLLDYRDSPQGWSLELWQALIRKMLKDYRQFTKFHDYEKQRKLGLEGDNQVSGFKRFWANIKYNWYRERTIVVKVGLKKTTQKELEFKLWFGGYKERMKNRVSKALWLFEQLGDHEFIETLKRDFPDIYQHLEPVLMPRTKGGSKTIENLPLLPVLMVKRGSKKSGKIIFQAPIVVAQLTKLRRRQIWTQRLIKGNDGSAGMHLIYLVNSPEYDQGKNVADWVYELFGEVG